MEDPNDITKLGYYLNRAFTRLVDDLDCALRKAGIPLNHSQFSILQVLSRNNSDTMSQREIAKRLGKDPAAISRSVIYLEREGFVARYPVNGCKNGVSLTEKAKELQPQIKAVIKEVTSKACIGMSKQQINSGMSFLTNLLKQH
ncbi:MAG: MarR family transcriptional regulator [Bacteroides sp.]|nr:MarR family transcriptional regulator [Bacteroides sp.]